MTDTIQSMVNRGMAHCADESPEDRMLTAAIPVGHAYSDESARVLAMAVKAKPGDVLCGTWDALSPDGSTAPICFASRTRVERVGEGSHHVCRAMNWLARSSEGPKPPKRLTRKVVRGLPRGRASGVD